MGSDSRREMLNQNQASRTFAYIKSQRDGKGLKQRNPGLTVSAILILILAIAAWLLSLHFYLVQHERIPANAGWLEHLLGLDTCRCLEIVETRFGRILGRSNAYWGMWYFLGLILISLSYDIWNLPPLPMVFLITLVAAAYSLYLAWGMLLLRVACRSCLLVHLANLGIFAIYLFTACPLLWD